MEYIVATENHDPKAMVTRRVERESQRRVANAFAEQHKASQTMPEDLDSWRDQNGRANHRTAAQPHFALLRMHATRFWFYGREWPEKRSPENKKGKRERIEEKNEIYAVTCWKKNCSRGQRAGRVSAWAATVIRLQLRHADRSEFRFSFVQRSL